MRPEPAGTRLKVDPVACEGIGLCAQITAAVSLDRWGYPVLGPVETAADLRTARRAVRACPRRALWMETVRGDTQAATLPG
ncbi:ferredoxin [Cellulomonas sp.]|uniref:ferredoxin n=1 Tax=Cellulomonas sp. TaxID=40001 RepID=UPI003BA8E2CA